ncbi:MAG: acyl-CoA/acyl-ACP dehydrogenase [Nitrososphaerota archaeon]|nr:acyl-CoA/acyl-ACP dehydrogenase [Nitrososphaerota archaeon]
MDFSFDNSIVEKIRAVSSNFDTAYWRQVYREERFPDEYWQAISKAGIFGLLIGEKYGGMEKSLLDLALATEETAERYAGIASYLFLSGNLVSQIFEKNSTEEQKNLLLPKLAKGELKISIALGEEVSGLDASSIETKASKISGGYVINGSKRFVNNVDRADYLVVFARTKPIGEKKSLGVSMFLVPAKNQEIKATKLQKLGMQFINNFDVEIKDLKVKDEDLVGELDRAWYNAVDSFNMDRVATAASLIGTGKLALNTASDYARKRTVFGKPIGSNQGIQFPLAEAMAQLLTAEAMMLKAASMQGNGSAFVSSANYALYTAEIAANYAAERALQTFGGHGYYSDYDVERYWRDVRVHKIHPISEELLLCAIAERSLGLPKSY